MAMFKYFKKQRSRDEKRISKNCDDVKPEITNNLNNGDLTKRLSVHFSPGYTDDKLFDDLQLEDALRCNGSINNGYFSLESFPGGVADTLNYQSRLSMILSSIIGDPHCLSYYIQYLETRDGLPLIKFYLDTENFKTAAVNQLEKEHHRNSEENCVLVEQSTSLQMEFEFATSENGKLNNEYERDNVPELKELCDLIMHKSLTDEKNKELHEKNTVQTKKCPNSKLKSNMQQMPSNNVAQRNASEKKCNIKNGRVCAASVRDAIAIYQKYLIANAKYFVYIPLMTLSQISLLLCKNEGGTDVDINTMTVPANCFDDAQKFILEHMEHKFLNDFLQSAFYCKYCIELIEGSLTIYDILYSEVTLFFFMEYLEQHGERDCLEFWTTAINFRKSFLNEIPSLPLSRDETEIRSDAMIIYEKFFSLQSECRPWMLDKLRCHVEECICDTGRLTNCFDLPLLVIAKYLEKKYFSDFLKSQPFENYLNELKSKVNNDISIMKNSSLGKIVENGIAETQTTFSIKMKNNNISKHRRTISDCTNESSREFFKQHISQHNTLLAMADSKNMKNFNTSSNNMTIDSRQLTNPKLLWQRSNSVDGSSGLKFGRVNSLGRYERDFEYLDTTSNGIGKNNWSIAAGGNKIKNAMRKLVNIPEDKVQEEIAWQVAEMIVKDVMSVTLCNDNVLNSK